RSIGEHLLQLDPLKSIPQCRLGRLRSVALSPGRMRKTPADVGMRTERMAGARWHDAGIAQELPVPALKGPAAVAVLLVRRHVAIEFGIARGAVQRAAQILRDLWIG